jgi:hypothetical protein
MDTDQFLLELLKGVSGNTNVIVELRRIVENQNKDNEAACKTLEIIKDDISKISSRLDGIDSWQKIKLPFIIGTITLVLYSLGFFFTLNRVAGMIETRHVSPISAPLHP